jgi:HEAT repeat protein
LPELVNALQDAAPVLCERTLSALRVLGPDAAPAAAAVARLLDHESAKIRSLAAQVIGDMGPKAQSAAMHLSRRLLDPDYQVRFHAGAALHELGLENVRLFLPALKDENVHCRLNAVRLLPMFHERREAMEGLVQCLSDKEVHVRAAAAANLVRLGHAGKEAEAALLENLTLDNREVQSHSLHALLSAHSFDNRRLLNSFAELNDKHQWAGPYVLHQFGASPGKSVKAIARLLQEGNDTSRLGGVFALAKLRGHAKEAVPALAKTAKDSGPALVRAAAHVALPAVDPRRKPNFAQAQALLREFMAEIKAVGNPGAEDVVHLYIFVNGLPRIDTSQEGGKEFLALVHECRVWARRALEKMPYRPWQIPVLVRGINTAAQLQLGFTEPFASLALKLRWLVDQSKDFKELHYAFNRLGSDVSSKSPLWGPIQQARLEALSNPFLLDRLMIEQQNAFGLTLGELQFLMAMNSICHFPRTWTFEPIHTPHAVYPQLSNHTNLAKNLAEKQRLTLQFLFVVKTRKLISDLWELRPPLLVEKLRDPNPLVRWSAVNIIHSKKIRAEIELIGLLRDPSREVREAAHAALIRLSRGTDFGPRPQDPTNKTDIAIRRWQEWLAVQQPIAVASPGNHESPQREAQHKKD